MQILIFLPKRRRPANTISPFLSPPASPSQSLAANAVMFTVFTNGIRIALSIHLPVYLGKYGLFNDFFTPERFHTLLGVFVYFSGLLLLWSAAEYAICLLTGTLYAKKQRLSFKLPLFWYCFIVLGLPFLNGAVWKNHTAFLSYAAIVLTGCSAILLMIRLLRRLFSRRSLFFSKSPLQHIP